MEVHHHPNVEKKNFKEYLLEFVMIFLAVTMGFIAESLREHSTNRTKENEYIAGFISNIKTDTAELARIIAFDKKEINGIDSFLLLAHVSMADKDNRKTFYYLFIKYFYRSASFKSNDATLQQLKSTGDYRLIEKDHVADSLSEYDADTHDIYNQGDYYTAYFKDILSRLDELTDMTVFNDTTFTNHGKFTNKPLPYLSDTSRLRVLFNKVFDFKIIIRSYENLLQIQLQHTTALLSFLKKEYGISG